MYRIYLALFYFTKNNVYYDKRNCFPVSKFQLVILCKKVGHIYMKDEKDIRQKSKQVKIKEQIKKRVQSQNTVDAIKEECFVVIVGNNGCMRGKIGRMGDRRL